MIFLKNKSNYPLESLRGVVSGQQLSGARLLEEGLSETIFDFRWKEPCL